MSTAHNPADRETLRWAVERYGLPPADTGVDLTAVSLFDGIGGFPAALADAGIRTVATVEIDKAAAGVTAMHFPDAAHFSDVTEVTADELRAAGFVPEHGVLTAGWPCQDLSLAGLRAGLGGARSGLFFEVVRLAAGLRPRWLILENVPGLLSAVCPGRPEDAQAGSGQFDLFGDESGDGLTHGRGACPGGCMAAHGGAMGLVLGALGGLGYGFAYRVLDAQHFGVPQRRRRVVIVGCLGDWAAPAAVLLEPEGGAGNPPAGGKARPGAARSTGAVPAGTGVADVAPTPAGGGTLIPHTANTLTTSGAQSADPETEQLTGFDAAQITSGENRSRPEPGDPQPPLAATGQPHVAYNITPQGHRSGDGWGGFADAGVSVSETKVAGTIEASGPGSTHVAYALRRDPGGVGQGHNTNYVVAPTVKEHSRNPSHEQAMVPVEPEAYQAQGTNVGPMGTLRQGNGGVTGGVPFTVTGGTTHALTSEGADASEDGTGRGTPVIAFRTDQLLDEGFAKGEDVSMTLAAKDTMHVAYGISSDAVDRSGEGDGSAGERAGLGVVEEAAPAVRARPNNAVAVAFGHTNGMDPQASEDATPTLRSGGASGAVMQSGWQGGSNQDQIAGPGDIAPTLAGASNTHGGHHQPKVVTPALTASMGGHHGAPGNAGQDELATATFRATPTEQGCSECLNYDPRGEYAGPWHLSNCSMWRKEGEVSATVTAKWSKGSGGPSGYETQNLAPVTTPTLSAHDNARGDGMQAEAFAAANLAAGTAVRRLTPVECERLQGYPDGWTATSNGKPQADSARYRQLGNSIAVPVFAWVTRRIAAYEVLHGPHTPAGGSPRDRDEYEEG